MQFKYESYFIYRQTVLIIRLKYNYKEQIEVTKHEALPYLCVMMLCQNSIFCWNLCVNLLFL